MLFPMGLFNFLHASFLAKCHAFLHAHSIRFPESCLGHAILKINDRDRANGEKNKLNGIKILIPFMHDFSILGIENMQNAILVMSNHETFLLVLSFCNHPFRDFIVTPV